MAVSSPGKFPAFGIDGGAVDQGLVDLQVIDTKGADVVERGIFAAEIVNGNFDAELPQLRQHLVLRPGELGPMNRSFGLERTPKFIIMT